MAWQFATQLEAHRKEKELFPNLETPTEVTGTVVGIGPAPQDAEDPNAFGAEDPDASWQGQPFTEGGSDEEWQEWVNWDEEEDQ